MSYDKTWIQHIGQPGAWLERRQAENINLSSEFETICNRLYTEGNFVVLSAGKNFMRDELFLFETATDAQEFFDRGFRDWESFVDDADEGSGFWEISLYQGGQRVATKSCEPTERTGVKK